MTVMVEVVEPSVFIDVGEAEISREAAVAAGRTSGFGDDNGFRRAGDAGLNNILYCCGSESPCRVEHGGFTCGIGGYVTSGCAVQ